MFRKFSNSLVAPKEVAKYYKESFWKSLLFLLVLVLLIMIPTVLNLSTSSFLTENMKVDVKKAFVGEEIPFEIKSGKLENVNGNTEYVYKNETIEMFTFVFTEKIENCPTSLDKFIIAFCEDGVYTKVSTFRDKIFSYTEYKYLQNLDFSNNDIFSDITFWDNMFGITENILNESKPFYIFIYSVFYIFYWIVWMAFFAIIIAFFSKIRTAGYLKYWDLLKLSVYSLSPFVICAVFATLFNMGFLIYLGYIIAAVFNAISVNEVLRNFYGTRKEGE